MNDYLAQFSDEMRAHGINPPQAIIPDGKLRRFAANGKASDDSGWYVFHDDNIPAGSFGDWRTGLSQSWRADIGRPLSFAESEAHRQRVTAMREQREAEEQQQHAEARERAAVILRAGSGHGLTSTRQPSANH